VLWQGWLAPKNDEMRCQPLSNDKACMISLLPPEIVSSIIAMLWTHQSPDSGIDSGMPKATDGASEVVQDSGPDAAAGAVSAGAVASLDPRLPLARQRSILAYFAVDTEEDLSP
jgi:hypothetical protein